MRTHYYHSSAQANVVARPHGLSVFLGWGRGRLIVWCKIYLRLWILFSEWTFFLTGVTWGAKKVGFSVLRETRIALVPPPAGRWGKSGTVWFPALAWDHTGVCRTAENRICIPWVLILCVDCRLAVLKKGRKHLTAAQWGVLLAHANSHRFK